MGSLVFTRLVARIDDPPVGRTPTDIHPLAPWSEHLAVRLSAELEPLGGRLARDIEGAPLVPSMKAAAAISELGRSFHPQNPARQTVLSGNGRVSPQPIVLKDVSELSRFGGWSL